MGEIADMMIDGTLDYITGEYIGRGVGYPRTTEKYLQEEYKKYQEENKWKAVLHFLWQKKIKSHMHPQVFKDYGCVYPRKSPLKKVCKQVLPEFEKFKKFVEDNLEKYSSKTNKN